VAAVTTPLVVVLRIEPDVMLEMVRFDVDAVPKYPVPETESAVDEAYGNCDAAAVLEAKKTPWVSMDEVVAAVLVANEVSEVKGYANAA
jgi:hypothetical protein